MIFAPAALLSVSASVSAAAAVVSPSTGESSASVVGGDAAGLAEKPLEVCGEFPSPLPSVGGLIHVIKESGILGEQVSRDTC